MHSEPGIVVSTHPSGEADLVLRIITRHYGKISALAKYARRSKRRFPSGLDLFDTGQLEAKPGRGSLYILQSFSPHRPFRALRTDLNRMTAATLVSESFEILSHEGNEESSETLYDLLELTLRAIDESDSLSEILRAVYLALANLLELCGYLDTQTLGAPNGKNLSKLLTHLETSTEKQLRSRASLDSLVHRHRAKASAQSEKS